MTTQIFGTEFAGIKRRRTFSPRYSPVRSRKGRGLAYRWALSRCPALAEANWSGEAGGMPSLPTTYPGYRFPAEVIQDAVWPYHLFSFSLRDIEMILAERA